MARAIERQLNLIAAQSLLKAASDLVPLRTATDSGSVEGRGLTGDSTGKHYFSKLFTTQLADVDPSLCGDSVSDGT